jgi:hypothetical protein
MERWLEAGVFDVQRTSESANGHESLADDLLDLISFCGAHLGPPSL